MNQKAFTHILGVPNFANYEATAALIKVPHDGGEIEYVTTAEERFSRVKHEYAFPLRGVHHCLQAFGLESLEQVDYIYTDHARVRRWLNSGPGYRKLDHDYIKLRLNYPRERIRVIDHHDGHAASAFYPSPFQDAAVLVVDGLGSRGNTQTLYHFTRSDAREIERGDYWGIGYLYALVTRSLLPYGPEKGYGKTMGLAPYGRVHAGPVLHFDARDAGMSSDYSAFCSRVPIPRIVAKDVRRCEDREAVLEPYFARAAHDLQQECERQMVRTARYAHDQTGAKHLCIAGGVGLNGLSNARILQQTPFEDVWITPGCSDTGLSLGVALWGYYRDIATSESPRVTVSMSTAYTGRPYPIAQTTASLDAHGIAHEPVAPEAVAGLIAAGSVVAWFEGGSEFGPRALGHRSILADPRDPGMKDTLNKRVKFREPYRPYAPSILEEHAAEWLHLDRPSPFMLMVVEVREEKRALVPAITHVDNTTRPQTVTETANPNYYRMLKEFHRLTGVPMVLNTSLNINREPIVETPIDALICVFGTAIDYLYIDGELVECARYARPELVQQLIADRARTLTEEWKTITAKYLTRYDHGERDAYLAEANKVAEWHRDYRAKYELEKKLSEWKAHQASVVIVGTRGHTRCLYEHIDGFPDLDVRAFVPLDDRPGEQGEFNLYPEYVVPGFSRAGKAPALDWSGVSAVLVSTHEYQGLVVAGLRQVAPPGVEVVTIYDDAGDSLLYVLPGEWPIANVLPGRAATTAGRAFTAGQATAGRAFTARHAYGDDEFDPRPSGVAERYALIVRYDPATVRPGDLDRQLKSLTQNFVCTTLGELTNANARLPEVVAVLTFDGLRNVAGELLPLLQRWKVPANVYCPASIAITPQAVDDIRRCQGAGLEIGIQGCHQPPGGQEDHVASIESFKTAFGLSAVHWAHPYDAAGRCSLTSPKALEELGAVSGVTRTGAIVKPSDLQARWELPRFDAADAFDASGNLLPDKLHALFVAD